MLLEIHGLTVCFHTFKGVVRAVDGVSLSIGKGEVLGVVGESGCGKSVTGFSIMGLIEEPGKIEGGRILFEGRDLLTLKERQLAEFRGREAAMIFQDPMTSLNPVITIGAQIVEALDVHHKKKSRKEAWDRAAEMLDLVGIPDAPARVRAYPHEFSGGMRQRAMIAMALACEPALLIADEPTTALDVTIQAQILELMSDLRRKIGTSVLLITHDLGVVSETCSRVIVMYGGQIMEEAPAEELFEAPLHPYTRGLMLSLPLRNGRVRGRLEPIPGTPPDLLRPPAGCPFVERCPEAMKICLEHRPGFYSRAFRRAACWRLDPVCFPGSGEAP